MRTQFIPDKHIGFEAMVDNCCPFVRILFCWFYTAHSKPSHPLFFVGQNAYWYVVFFYMYVGVWFGRQVARCKQPKHFCHSRHSPFTWEAPWRMCIDCISCSMICVNRFIKSLGPYVESFMLFSIPSLFCFGWFLYSWGNFVLFLFVIFFFHLILPNVKWTVFKFPLVIIMMIPKAEQRQKKGPKAEWIDKAAIGNERYFERYSILGRERTLELSSHCEIIGYPCKTSCLTYSTRRTTCI